jgi:hypothetical protein
MKFLKVSWVLVLAFAVNFSGVDLYAAGQDYSGNEDPNKKILKQGLLGAGVGAISAEASGGKAGTGALVGAGTNVIGGALLDTLTAPSAPRPQQVQYVPAAPAAPVAPSYASYPVQTRTTTYPSEPQPVYVQQAPAYYPPQEDPTKKILKQGLLGAGTGAIAASASGGKAGKGALIGAGTNVIGGALLDMLSGPSQSQPQPQPVYYQQQAYPQQAPSYSSSQPKKKILRKYDADGNVVSEEEVWE